MEEHNVWLDVFDALTNDFLLYVALAVMTGTLAAHWLLGVASYLSERIETLMYSKRAPVSMPEEDGSGR